MNKFLCLQDLADFFGEPIQRRGMPPDPGTMNWNFEKVCTDSRALQAGDLFVPIKGERFDANTFAEEALKKGASFVIIDNQDYFIDERTILVEDTLEAFGQFEAHNNITYPLPESSGLPSEAIASAHTTPGP